jgi:hypothetical protein
MSGRRQCRPAVQVSNRDRRRRVAIVLGTSPPRWQLSDCEQIHRIAPRLPRKALRMRRRFLLGARVGDIMNSTKTARRLKYASRNGISFWMPSAQRASLAQLSRSVNDPGRPLWTRSQTGGERRWVFKTS